MGNRVGFQYYIIGEHISGASQIATDALNRATGRRFTFYHNLSPYIYRTPLKKQTKTNTRTPAQSCDTDFIY